MGAGCPAAVPASLDVGSGDVFAAQVLPRSPALSRVPTAFGFLRHRVFLSATRHGRRGLYRRDVAGEWRSIVVVVS